MFNPIFITCCWEVIKNEMDNRYNVSKYPSTNMIPTYYKYEMCMISNDNDVTCIYRIANFNYFSFFSFVSFFILSSSIFFSSFHFFYFFFYSIILLNELPWYALFLLVLIFSFFQFLFLFHLYSSLFLFFFPLFFFFFFSSFLPYFVAMNCHEGYC